MADCAAKHHARNIGLVKARDTTSTGGGRSQGIGKFLQGSDASNSIVWVGNVDTFGFNGKEDRGTHTELLRMITGKRAKQLKDGTWETPGVEGTQEAAGTQSDRIYI